jgi:hypothetical protein
MEAATLKISDTGAVTIPEKFLAPFRGKEVTIAKSDEDNTIYLSSVDPETLAERERERQQHNAAYFAELDEAEEQIKRGECAELTLDDFDEMKKTGETVYEFLEARNRYIPK